MVRERERARASERARERESERASERASESDRKDAPARERKEKESERERERARERERYRKDAPVRRAHNEHQGRICHEEMRRGSPHSAGHTAAKRGAGHSLSIAEAYIISNSTNRRGVHS